MTPEAERDEVGMSERDALGVAFAAVEYIGGFYDEREPDEYVRKFRRECCDAMPHLTRLLRTWPERVAFERAAEVLIGCAICFEQEWADRYGDSFRDAATTYRAYTKAQSAEGGTE